jgi:hypothetical protein
MRRKTVFLTLVALASSTEALALGSLADVEVIDRVSGETLELHYFRGEYWVAGRPGAKYALRVRNQSGGRVLAVMSVDGVNVLSGATAGYDQEGYIFSPGTAYDITGWRKSQWEVAAFTFTDAANSYAGRTGRPANVGVIGVALFRERLPPPVALTSPVAPAPVRAPAYSAGAAAAREGMLADSAAVSGGSSAPQPATKLGTGHGEREGSYVDYAAFDREAARPNEVVRIRYDSAANLLALGVIRRPPPLPAPRPVPFPDNPPSFVPDPPG